MSEVSRNSTNQVQFDSEALGTESTGIFGRFKCRFNPEQAAQNLKNFSDAVNYLRSKCNILGTRLDEKLTEQLNHYNSNGRGVNGNGGRLRAFTQDDFKNLEKECVRTSYTQGQRALLSKIDNIASCTIEQEAIILKYGESMIEHGYKEAYVLEVCQSMVKLYGAHIKDVLPKTIGDYEGFTGAGATTRENVTKIVHQEITKTGGDPKLIARYLDSQQKQGSWHGPSLLMKGFHLKQRAVIPDKTYYLGTDGTNPENLIAYFDRNCPNPKVYAKTVAMYQAFIAIALNHIDDIPGIDKERGTLEVYRGVTRYNEHGPQGIADSTALISVAWGFARSKYILKMEVPLCDVKAMYFLSPELSCDLLVDENGVYSAYGEGGNQGSERLRFAAEREIVCDLSHAQITEVTEGVKN